MIRLIKKLTSYLALVALLVPMVSLAMPQGARAAADATGGTVSVVNGTGASIALSHIKITSDLVNDIETTRGIEIQLVDETVSANARFDTSVSPTVVKSAGAAFGIGTISINSNKLTIGILTANANAGDSVTIDNLRVKAGPSGNTSAFEGWAYLRVLSGTTPDVENLDHFKVDAKKPVLTITGPVNDSLVNKPPVLGYTVESGATVAVTLKGKNLGAVPSGTTLNNGIVQGDNQLAITATDVAGNAITEYRSFKYDSTAPGYTVGANPDGATVANDSTVVFEGTAEQSANVKLIIKDENTDLIVKESGPFSRSSDSWRFEISAADIGAGWHDAYVEITDSAGNVTLQKIARFGIASPVVKATYRTQRTYAVSGTSTTSLSGTTPQGAVTPAPVSDKTKEQIKQEAQEAAEGIVKTAEAQNEEGTSPWQTVVTVIAILIIAIGVGTAGYYGYEWWATRKLVTLSSNGPAEAEDDWAKPATSARKSVKKTTTAKSKTKKTGSRRSSSRW